MNRLLHRTLFSFLFTCGLLLAAPLSASDLNGFFAGLERFSATFEQTVSSPNGLDVEVSRGRVWIQRPDRFRWSYEEPYLQEIVADGVNLWTFDADLEQATVKPMDEVLTATPAMVLSGREELERVFTVTSLGQRDGRRWFLLMPTNQDGGVEEIQLALRDDRLELMEVVDPLGNHTRLVFSGLVRNPELEPDLFRFEPPAGSDVIGTPQARP